MFRTISKESLKRKRNFTMTEKNADFPRTSAAFADLSAALAQLNSAIDSKKSELAQREKKCQAEFKSTEDRLNLLKASSQNIINNINQVMTRLDNVLENDGSSNNNN